MATPEQAAAVDTQNMEHSGDWDHGVEPDALNEAGEPKDQDKKGISFIKKAQAAVANALHNIEAKAASMGEKAAQALHEDQLKQGVENHTEEEVAGQKLCVSKTVHQDSFIAPC